jgi:hypothetical protein
MGKFGLTEEDMEAAVVAMKAYKKLLDGKRPATTVDVFYAGFHYGCAHARLLKATPPSEESPSEVGGDQATAAPEDHEGNAS